MPDQNAMPMKPVDNGTTLPSLFPEGARLEAPSLPSLAAEAIRKMILASQFGPGERLIEERLSEQLGISRPPIREALQLLQREGLVVTKRRKGASVVALTDQDVYEILTLRSALERLAIEIGVPVRLPERLDPVRVALEEMERCAQGEDRGGLVQAGYAFHSKLVGIAGHRRLEEAYASVQQQLILCMALNLYARERYHEGLKEHVARHRHLLELVEQGDPDAVLKELAVHGERSFQAHKHPAPEG